MGLVMPTYHDVLHHVRTLWFGTRGLRNFLLAFVDGFPDDPWQREVENGMCMQIAYMLVTDNCDCGPHCHQKHNLNEWPRAKYSWEQYVYSAVIGPAGKCTNSIAQGMTYPFLKDIGIHARPVEFKVCHDPNCGLPYEGGTCPYCGLPFHPQATRVIARDWLVMQGGDYYNPVFRWKCISDSRHPHYYYQEKCITQFGAVYHPHHRPGVPNDGCDCCPWEGCQPGRHHGQNATTLWTRWAGPPPPVGTAAPAAFIAGISKGIKNALAGLDNSVQDHIFATFGDDRMTIAVGLLADPQDILSDEQLNEVRQTVIRALQCQGFDGEAADEWLCSAIELSTVQQVTGDEGGGPDGNQ